jgi:CheY-like chemotaxis protein
MQSTSPPDEAPVILVAEDEAPVRDLVALVLRTAGYRTVLCTDGEEAIAALTSEPRLDLALIDLRMPRLDGVQVIAAIRRHALWKSIRVVVMSAYSDDVQRRKVQEAGADRFLPKPFTVSALKEAVCEELEAASGGCES